MDVAQSWVNIKSKQVFVDELPRGWQVVAGLETW